MRRPLVTLLALTAVPITAVPITAVLLTAPTALAAPAAGPVVQTLTEASSPGSHLAQDGTRQVAVSGTTSSPACQVRVERRSAQTAPWEVRGAPRQASSTTFRFVDTVVAPGADVVLQYRVRAVDCTGTPGGSRADDEFSSVAYDGTSGTLAWSGPLTSVATPGAYGGSWLRAEGLGTQVTALVPGDAIALYAHLGPQGGVADVLLDGAPAGTVSFWSATPRNAVCLWGRPTTAPVAKHRLKYALRAAGPGGGTQMGFDAFVGREGVHNATRSGVGAFSGSLRRR